MPEPRFSGSSTLQLSYFRFKTVPRRSSPPSIVTRPPRDAPVGPGGACCRRGSSTRSAPSPAPARHYAPASRPCRCSGPRRHARRGPEPTNGSCCLASRARSTACCGGPCDGSGSDNVRLEVDLRVFNGRHDIGQCRQMEHPLSTGSQDRKTPSDPSTTPPAINKSRF